MKSVSASVFVFDSRLRVMVFDLRLNHSKEGRLMWKGEQGDGITLQARNLARVQA